MSNGKKKEDKVQSFHVLSSIIPAMSCFDSILGEAAKDSYEITVFYVIAHNPVCLSSFLRNKKTTQE